jgi:hypothetical protein
VGFFADFFLAAGRPRKVSKTEAHCAQYLWEQFEETLLKYGGTVIIVCVSESPTTAG